ncbi:hypothetical protein PIB30_106962, partial [Stylosanthes scabra]|nr:hypothetical protein [Stylosanthes scabra]
MSAETSWKDNTKNLCEVPCICVEAYAYAWPGNSAAPRIMPRTQVYAWNITPRRGQASSSTQNPNLGVEASQAAHKHSRVHAYAWKSTLMRG